MSLLRGHWELEQGQGFWARACVLPQAANMTVTWLADRWTFCSGLWLVLERTLLTAASGNLLAFPAKGKSELRSSLLAYTP